MLCKHGQCNHYFDAGGPYEVHTLNIFIPADLGATETDAMLCSGYWSRRCSRSRDPSPEPLRQRGKRREHCQSYGKDHKEHQKEEDPLTDVH